MPNRVAVVEEIMIEESSESTPIKRNKYDRIVTDESLRLAPILTFFSLNIASAPVTLISFITSEMLKSNFEGMGIFKFLGNFEKH